MEQILIDDEKDLPDLEHLQIDEDLLSIQRNDAENDIERQKHFFSRNWKMIGCSKRLKLVLSVLVIIIPLVAFILFCASEVANKYHDDLEGTSKANNPDAYYAEVTAGAVLGKITNIHSETSSYETRMQLFLKFDKDEFRNMFRHYARNGPVDQIIDSYYADSSEPRPSGILSFDEWIDSHSEYFEEWIEAHDHEYYPGETPSNVFTDKETMFVLGNGEFVPDSMGVMKELEEIQYYDEEGNLRTMCYQKIRFNGASEKAFDSVRYPLDSVQFNLHLQESPPSMRSERWRGMEEEQSDMIAA